MNKLAAYNAVLERNVLWKTAMYGSDNPYAKSTELTDEEKALARQQQLNFLGGTAAGAAAGAAFGSSNRFKGGVIGAGLGALGSLIHSGATGGLYSKRLADAHAKARQWEKDNPGIKQPNYDRYNEDDRAFLQDFKKGLEFDDDHHPVFEKQEDLEDYMHTETEKHIDQAYAALKKKTGKDIGRQQAAHLYYNYR